MFFIKFRKNVFYWRKGDNGSAWCVRTFLSEAYDFSERLIVIAEKKSISKKLINF